MPRVQLAHVPADDFDDFRFPSPFHEQHQWPRFVNRGIVSGRSVDLEPLHHKYLNDMLVGYGWGRLMDLPEVMYPNLVQMFYTNVELKGHGARTVLKFYLKGKWYTLNRSILASIFDIELGNQFAYFVFDFDLKDIADNMGDDMLNTIIETICVDCNTPGGIVRRNLEPHLYLFHVWILENILPKAGHLDAVTSFECYILYFFETEVYLDLPYIIMKEIIRIREAADDSKALGFGAMLTKIFKVFYVDLEGEEIIPTKGPINSISVTSSKISEKIAAREHDRGNPRVANVVAPPAPADPAPAPVLDGRIDCVLGNRENNESSMMLVLILTMTIVLGGG
ncbi:hypothetical protein Dimus_022721 [Dionaea muscipula]